MNKSKVLCLLLVLVLSPAIWSGQITPYLADYLQGMAADNDVEIVVMFQNQADIETLNRQLKLERVTLAERNMKVIEALQEVAGETQPLMSAYLDDLKAQNLITDYRMAWIANMCIVKSSRAGVYEIAAQPSVADIHYSYPIEGDKPMDSDSEPSLIASHEIGLDKINAPAAWAAGFTGLGRVVANMDTGVDGNHPALSNRFRGDVDDDGDVDESWYDPYAGWTFPQDSGSHGTHTLGTICGRTESGSDTIGVAIDAQWIAAAPIDRGGGISGTIADAILSFQWFADPDGDPTSQDNPDVVGNSWGIPDGAGYPDCDQSFWAVIDNLEAAGTVVVFSAGNEGSNGLRSPADRAATLYNCFSVGAVNGNNPSLPPAYFTALGPTECASGELAIKPEVTAPGVDVRSSVPGGGYTTMSGTSMSSPHVSGAVALIRQANPDLDVESLKEILMSTAVDLPLSNPDGEDNTYGHGIIDVYQACLVAQSGYGFVNGYVYDEDNDPITGALVSVDDGNRNVYSDDVGFYALGLPADTTYSITASFFGHVSESVELTIIADETIVHDFHLSFAEYGVLHGHVTDLDMNPIEDAQISVASTPLDPVYTNAEGYYIIDNIPGGAEYLIEAAAAGYGLARASVFVPLEDTAVLDFELQELESFEIGNGGYVGEGVWQWGVPTSGPGGAYDGNNVWATSLGGQYVNNADDDLLTTLFQLEDNPVFSFYHWYNMESGYNDYDGGNVQISIDGGYVWEIIYPDEGYPSSSIIGLDGEPGFTGESNGWRQDLFDLSAYAGQTAFIKFRFGSDGSVLRDGWYIDGVVMSGGTVIAPEADITPTSFDVHLELNQISTLPLTVSNNGDAQLDFSCAVITDALASYDPSPTAPENVPVISVDIAKDKDAINAPVDESDQKVLIDPPFNYDVITDFGGPDEFGYTFIDSDEENGPHYDWVDISGIGTVPTFNGYNPADDGYTDLIPMGMSFTFYGQTYSEIVISTNGWVGFQAVSSSYLSNSALPNVNQPNALIAVEWDDLDGGNDGVCYYYYDDVENQFIVSWTNWYYYPDPSTPMHNIQVILNGNDNSITMQYGDISGGSYQSDVTVGIENETGTVGLMYIYDNSTIQPGTTVKFIYPLFWLTVTPGSGSVMPGESTDLDVTFDATVLEEGTYTGTIIMTTNDPGHSQFNIPVTLHVGPVGVDDQAATPTAFSLSQNYPNPFNPITDISFGLPASGQVTLEVYDIMGRKVRTLVDGHLSAGVHQITWDGANSNGEQVTSGMYFYKLTQGDNVTTRKMMLLK